MKTTRATTTTIMRNFNFMGWGEEEETMLVNDTFMKKGGGAKCMHHRWKGERGIS
jgi:hypothetical protein